MFVRQEEIADAYMGMIAMDKEESMKRCQRALEENKADFEENILTKSYKKPGGYADFKRDIEELKRRYNASAKGVCVRTHIMPIN